MTTCGQVSEPAFGEGHEGLLPVRRLRGDWWELDELETMLVGAQSGKAIRLGDPVTVAKAFTIPE